MTVTIPSTDVEGTKLNGVITARNSLITAAGTNGALAAVHAQEKAQAQINLVVYLISTGKLNAATILSNETYGT